jgi:hypothetical protein
VPSLQKSERRTSLFALVRLCERRLLDAWAVKAARVYAIGVVTSYLVAFVFFEFREAGLLFHVVGTLAWVCGGLVLFGAARDPERTASELGVVALVRQRGFSTRELELARVLAIGLRLVRVVGIPGVLFSVIVLSAEGSLRAAANALVRSLGVAVFALSLSAGLALLAGLSRWAAPRRTRLTLFALVLLPHWAGAVAPSIPSVPRAGASLLALCLGEDGA